MEINISWDPHSPDAAEANGRARELLTARCMVRTNDPNAPDQRLFSDRLRASIRALFDGSGLTPAWIQDVATRTMNLVSAQTKVGSLAVTSAAVHRAMLLEAMDRLEAAGLDADIPKPTGDEWREQEPTILQEIARFLADDRRPRL